MGAVISVYLRELKKVKKVRIVYGKHDQTTKETECLDVSNIVEMIDWIYATKLFKDFGYSSELAGMIKKVNEKFYKNNSEHKRPTKLKSLSESLQDVSNSIRLGSIHKIHDSMKRFVRVFSDTQLRKEVEKYIPQFYLLFDSIMDQYKRFYSNNDELCLNCNELKSEKELLKFYLETGDLGMATRLAREYYINVRLFKECNAEKFLDLNERESISISPDKLGILVQARNHIAHFGFNKDSMPKVEKIQKEIEKLTDMDEDEIVEEYNNVETKKAILTPLGTTPGALYTVLNKIPADVVVILTSEKGQDLIPEIFEKSGFKGEHHIIFVKDPFKGIDETNNIIKEIKNLLEETTEVVINLTGGTTLMNYMIERARDKIRHGRKIKTIIAYDERPSEEQRKNPYVLGNILKLNSSSTNAFTPNR